MALPQKVTLQGTRATRASNQCRLCIGLRPCQSWPTRFSADPSTDTNTKCLTRPLKKGRWQKPYPSPRQLVSRQSTLGLSG